MNKKSKKTLKNAFNIPEPNQKESFFSKLDINPQRKFSSFVPVYLPTAVVAVMIIGVWGGIKNLPRFEQPENTDNNIIYSSESSVSENQTDSPAHTSASSVHNTEKQTHTSATVQTDSKSSEKNTSVTTVKTTKDNPDKEESFTDSPSENPSEENSDSEVLQTTDTTRKTNIIKTTDTTETTKHTTPSQTTTTKHNVYSPQTTTTTFKDSIDIPSGTTEPSQPSDDVPQDYTVTPPVRYYPDDNAIDISDITQNDPQPPLIDGPQPGDSTSTTWEDFMNNSDIILIATVDEIIYTGIDGVPYTQENISVSEVIKGDIEQYSRISVYGTGGYIPASEYKKIQIEWAIENNYTIFDPAGNKTFSEVGDTYLYFIRKSNYPLPDGSYRLTTYNDISKFRYTDGYYVNMNNNNLMFKLTELYDSINN